ncbi:antibiotic biosynthesis monooxygenase family protein [Streptomyces sp. NPDC052309]|uniref:antibiotic biosynthesis monooxygenase family protein n=1 Tax=Streptomyces sp. NPDC052309 TaxID=3155421 RepID=UPI00342426ED
MITEIAQIQTRPGQEHQFEEAVAKALPHFLAADGCDGVDLYRSVEHPSCYRLMIPWETVEHHTVTFRGSEGFAMWRALAGPHFAAPSQAEHVHSVLVPDVGGRDRSGPGPRGGIRG